MTLSTALLVSLACASSGSAPAQDASSSYRLSIVSAEPLRVTIEAVVPAASTLSMDGYGAWSQPRGWATFVHELDVRDSDGRIVDTVEHEAGWRVTDSESSTLALSYTVDLAHLSWANWPDGPRTTSGYRAANGSFVLLGALLVHAELDVACELVFDGAEWGQVAAPFESPRQGAYRIDSLRARIKNPIAFQVEEYADMAVDDMRVQVVALDGAAAQTDLLPEVLRRSLEEFAELFASQPDGDPLAIVYLDRWDTGEAYEDGFVLATTRVLSDDSVPLWGQSVAHEVFHRWLGHEIRGASWSESNWFSEGVTDYASSLFLVRNGFVDVAVFLDQLEKHAAFHRLYHKGPPFAGLDLVSAGADKGPNNAAIYDGGWLTAFSLDVQLQERTEGRLGLEDLLRELRAFSADVEGGYEVDDILGLLNEISDSDFGEFFDRHVRGAEPLALVDLCEAAGIRLLLGAVQPHARIELSADPEAARIRRRILSGAPADASGSLSARIDDFLAVFDDAKRPGLALTVAVDEEHVHSRGYGSADLERAHPIQPDTVFHAASVSKQFTAFLIHMLAAEGKLRLGDAVRDWIPELTCADGVRIRHLLDHTSGIRDQWQLLGLAGVRTDGDFVTQDDVLRILFRQEALSFEPGTQQAYCNSGYTLLAEIAARASGVAFPELARERIFEPLGMDRTFFQDSPTRLVYDRALSYERTAAGFEPMPIGFGTYGATGLMTTTEDLIPWCRNFWEPRVGTPAIVAAMLERGVLVDGTEVNFANGLHVSESLGKRTIGHPGADAGYRSAVLIAPEERLAVALLGNVDSVDMWGLPDRVLQVCTDPLADVEPAGEPEIAPNEAARDVESRGNRADAAHLAQYVGTYYSREVDTSYELKIVDGALWGSHLRNGSFPVDTSSDDLLRCDRWYLTELETERDAEDRVVAFRAHSSRSRGVRFVRR